MKKPLLLCVLTLALTSCDLSKYLPINSGKQNNGNNHDGTSLLLQCADGLNVATHDNQIYMENIDFSSIQVGSTTIKRLDGEIHFYRNPVYGHAQLEEIPDNANPEMYYFEMDIDFKSTSNKEIDFVYFTGVSWNTDNEDNLINKYLRLAVFDKETKSDYFVFSHDTKGLVTKTEYNLDLDADGKLDEDENGLINYTTGMPSYMTDNYEIVAPGQNEIDSDKFDRLHSCMRVDTGKPLTIRMWVEGWELDNNVALGEANIGIELDFAPHFAK